MTARILECTEDEYFRDPCAVPSLSQTIANILNRKSLLHAWNEHPALGNAANPDGDDDVPEKEKESTRDGKVIHKLMLGKGCDIEVVNVDKYSTNVARAQRDDAIRAGRVPIKIRKYDDLVAAAETIKGNLALEGVDLDDPDGESELAVEFQEEGEHGLVTCRARIDRVNRKRGTIYELKKIVSADDKTCSKHVAQYGYDVQWASNTHALAALCPHLSSVDMVFVFFEVTPPFAVNVKRPSPVMREIGRMQWEKAVLLWERALRTNRWPGYGGSISELDPPHWYVNELLGNWEGTDLTDLGLQR